MRILKILGIAFLTLGLLVSSIFANWHWKKNNPHSCAFYAYHSQKKAITVEYKGDIYHFDYIPQCTILANYLAQQSIFSTGTSFCVDSNGEEIPHTFVGPEQYQSLPCHNTFAKVFNYPLVDLFLLPPNPRPFISN